jgi:hypothetical protein
MNLRVRVWRILLDALDQNRTPILLASLFLILLGTRALLISYAGSPTPFLDEWEADGARLLQPYIQGDLTLSDLFIPLNEHRIFFTKLLVLLIFNVSGYWDVVLQMIVNSVVNSATVVAIAYTLSRVLCGGLAVAAIVLSTLLNAVPFGYDNAVLGFNTHFYLLLTFSFAALWFLTDSPAWSWRWGAGVLCAVGASLCLASGALTFAAAGGAQLMQMARGRRAGLHEALGIAVLVVITLALASTIPHVPDAEPVMARSVVQFASAFVGLASWPAHTALGLVLILPTLVFLSLTVAHRPTLSDPRWFNVAIFGWVVSQMLALAVGRASLPLQSRYFDILLICAGDVAYRPDAVTDASAAASIRSNRGVAHDACDRIEKCTELSCYRGEFLSFPSAGGGGSVIFPKAIARVTGHGGDSLRPAANVAFGQRATPMGRGVQDRLPPARQRLDCNRDASPDHCGHSVAARRDKTGHALGRQVGSRDR